MDFFVYLIQQVKKLIPYPDWAPCCFISLILIFSYSYLRSLFSLSLDLGENHFQEKYIFNLSHEPNTRLILSSLLSFFISPLSKLILSQQNYVFQRRCLKIASRIFSIKSASVQVIHSRLIPLCRLRTMWRGLHLMCHGEQQGSLGESPALPDEQSWKSLWALPVFERWQGGKVFVLSVISSGKNTMLPVRAPACTHTLMSAPACVSLHVCVYVWGLTHV